MHFTLRAIIPWTVLFGVLLVGCTASQSTTTPQVETTETWSPDDVEARLESATSEWAGTPHQWGGESPSGIDCSGLVQSVYETHFQLGVPRTTGEQARVGRTVSRAELQPGDLVFFHIASTKKNRHVGIYLSDQRFLHASSSEGVRVSSLDRSYWKDRWSQGRRLLDLSGVAPSSEADTTTAPSSNAGVGW